MKECDFASFLGLSLHETQKKWEYGFEVRAELHDASKRELIAWCSITTRTSDGEQMLSTSSQFIQRDHLTREQVDAITQWQREYIMSARWRLTTYTMVEARP